MQYLNPKFSVGPAVKRTCCERCVYGSGEHADFCEWRVQFVEGGPTWGNFFDPEKWRDALYSFRIEPHPLGEAIAGAIAEMRVYPAFPKGTVAFLAPRKPDESEAEWFKRCAIITNVEEIK